MKKILPKVVVVLFILLMLSPILVDVLNSTPLKSIKYKNFDKIVEQTARFGFSVVYVAPKSDEDLKDYTKDLKVTLEELDEKVQALVQTSSTSASSFIGSYYLDYDALDDDAKKNIFGEEDSKYAYLFLANGELLKVIPKKLSMSEFRENYNLYRANGIADNQKKYQTAKNASEYKKSIKEKDAVKMSVFGRDSCYYCNQFKVVYNTIADENDLDDIYYFDSDSYNEDEFEKVLDSGLKIPAACNSKGEDVDLQEGYSTPLTLFTKNGKVIDCISGYVTKETLITKLKTVGMLK